MKRNAIINAVLATAVLGTAVEAYAGSGTLGTASASGVRRFDDRTNRRTYIYVPGTFTQQQAWATARLYGGYPVVFESMSEHTRVVGHFGYGNIAPCHTGHYQLAKGREPGAGWVTYTEPHAGARSAPVHKLFNGNGPDDGVRNKWGWSFSDEGLQVFYGPGTGKNEDAAVIWHDNGGKLEDVSVNHRGGVLIEINR